MRHPNYSGFMWTQLVAGVILLLLPDAALIQLSEWLYAPFPLVERCAFHRVSWVGFLLVLVVWAIIACTPYGFRCLRPFIDNRRRMWLAAFYVGVLGALSMLGLSITESECRAVSLSQRLFFLFLLFGLSGMLFISAVMFRNLLLLGLFRK